jgi:5'-3' exoribonuclease 2
MLGLGTHEPYFRVLREDVFAQDSRPRGCRLCGQTGHKAEECIGRPKEKTGEFDEKQNAAPLKPFIWLHVAVLREYLAVELRVPQQPFPFDLERALDDWVFMCFFVGNDFLPHLPSLDIRENGIDTLIAIWRDNLPAMGSYLTKDGSVELKNAQIILQGLAKQEDAIFRRRRQADERRQANEKRRKEQDEARNAERSQKRRRSSPQYDAGAGGRSHGGGEAAPPMELITPGRGHLDKETRELTHNMITNRGAVYRANMENKSAAAVLKSKLMRGNQDEPEAPATAGVEQPLAEVPGQTSPGVLGKRKADADADADAAEEEDTETGTPGRDSPPPPPVVEKPKSDEPAEDTVKLWEPGYADRYYEQKFKVDPQNHEFRHQVARDYALGLCWVLRYYFQGCPSWNWYYPHHYAPFAADFVDIADMPVEFDKGKPFKPFEQLMGVLPASSNHALPQVFHPLMEDENSPIIDFYPEDFPLDLNGKKFAWQGVILLPFIDERRLLDAMATVYPLLTDEEKARNAHGQDVLLLSDRNPLYQDLVANFYSKKPGPAQYSIKQDLSAGLAGIVERSETYIPHSSLVSPLEAHGMPGVDDDRSLTVLYTIPKSSHVHKSMLLRGVKLPTPMLDSNDIRATQGRAQNSGRSFGGAPFQGRGRGGRMNYQSDRPNPFAGHLDPNFTPGPPGGPNNAHMVPPGWNPPTQGYGGYSRGPPPPPRGGMANQYPPQQGYQQQQPGGYYNPQNQYNQGGQYNNGYQQGGGYGSQDYRGGRGGGGNRGGRGRGNYHNQGGGGYGRY